MISSPIPNGTPRWGLYDQGGSPILVASSVYGVEYARDYRVSDYPQEQGAFASYNKVNTPFQAKITYLVGGSMEERAGFLAQAEAVVASLNLIAVVTPEIVYPSANPTHISYRRTARQGVTLLLVEIWCEEIRVISGVGLSNTRSLNGATPQQNGNVQAGTETFSDLNIGGDLVPGNITTKDQQSTIDRGGQDNGASGATVSPADDSGNVAATYSKGSGVL